MSASLMGKGSDDKKGGLPLIRCFCGAEILIIPSIERMNLAIEAHVQKHRRKIKGPKRVKDVEAELIREHLTTDMFEKVIQRT